MTTCQECNSFFPLEEDQGHGDCVRRVVDPRQRYFKAKPVNADDDAGACESFQKQEQ